MAEHVFTVLCRRAIVDEATKIPSLIDIIDGFEYSGPENIEAQPAFPLELAVVTQWTRSDPNTPEMSRHRLNILGPKPPREPPPSFPEVAVDLTTGRSHRTTFAMQGFPNYGIGDYSLLIELLVGAEWIVAKNLTFTIKRKAAV
jgi:hypothetical protein